MHNFTEAYKKAADVLSKQKFADAWQKQLQDKWSIGKFLRPTGFERDRSAVPEKLREALTTAARKDGSKPGDVIHVAATNALSAGQLTDRAAAMKFLQHVHRARSSGGQSVWVYAPPKSDSGWVFDEITGDDATIKQRLNRDDEIFSGDERKWMTSALMISRKISEDCKHKLAGGILRNVKASTLEVVKRWFCDEDSTDASTEETVRTLLAGFRKIATACSSPTLVFTDYPDWRAQRDDYFGAAFRGGEGGGFPVIYLEGAFTRLTGNSGQQWLCAETIIHELSHHEVKTEDHRYDHHGLKPNKAAFPASKAIENADSWGYFALDLAGYLSVADRSKVYK